MTQNKCTGSRINLQEIFEADKDSRKESLRQVLQEVLEQEMKQLRLRKKRGLLSG